MISNKNLFYSYLAQTSPEPMALEIKKAKGVYLFSPDGKKYLDLISGISVSNVGHSHPNIVRAVNKQVKKHFHLMVYGEYIQSPQVKLAQALSHTLPDNLNNVYFVNSGSEANEGAMKLAKRYTGKSKIVYCKNAYHGSTQGVLSVIGSDEFKTPFQPLLPETYSINYNNFDHLSIIDQKTAAIIIEPIQAEAGVIVPENNYLKKVREKCNETGTLLIFDEVQTGFGRTGTFWGFENFGVIPDIITTAKGMGGGMPLGAFISSKAIMETLTHHPVLGHITTFGGHPVCCAASLACLELIKSDNILQSIPEKELLFRQLLQHPFIIEVRGKGLLLCIEFLNKEFNFSVIHEAIKNGLITDWFLFNDKCLRIAPPLNITTQQIKRACKILVSAIETVANKMTG